MTRSKLILVTLATAIGFVNVAPSQETAPTGDPGWTGATEPEAVIAARQALMIEMERLMRPIDTIGADEPDDPAEIHSMAETIAAMLLATPHLFPPTTDLYDESDEMPQTFALPAIWENFTAFYALSAASTNAASRLASAEADDMRDAAAALRASCDACHALSLRPYAPPQITEEDLDIDFDSLFSD